MQIDNFAPLVLGLNYTVSAFGITNPSAACIISFFIILNFLFFFIKIKLLIKKFVFFLNYIK